jgi:hypothetical protein
MGCVQTGSDQMGSDQMGWGWSERAAGGDGIVMFNDNDDETVRGAEPPVAARVGYKSQRAANAMQQYTWTEEGRAASG